MARPSDAGAAPNAASQQPLALLILDLQSDFFFPTGKLASSAGPGFEDDSFANIVRTTRHLGTVIWARTEFYDEKFFDPADSTAGGDKVLVELQLDPDASTEDEPVFLPPDASTAPELFLTVGLDDEEDLIAQPGSFGAGFIALAEDLLDDQQDDFLVKSSYSAFNSTALLDNLRESGISHVAICGSLTNVSILATALDAIKNGFEVTVVEDCLSYCSLNAHRDALTCMREALGVKVVTGVEYLQTLADLRVDSPLSSEGRTDSPERHLSPTKRSFANGESRIASPSPSPSLPRSESQAGSRKSLIPMRPVSAADKLPPLRTKSLSKKPSRQSLLRQPSYGGSPASIRSPRPSPLSEQPSRSGSASPGSDRTTAGGKSSMARQHRLAVVTLGPDDEIGEGDSSIIHAKLDQVLGPQLASGDPDSPAKHLFTILKDEVYWQKMYHVTGEVPRLVCAQGEFEPDGSMPLYRHPADESLPLLRFSKAVNAVREYVQSVVGHPLNHCLVQLYRGGQDFISEHSDKTLDIVRGSSIVNVSLGAQRVMRLRTKKSAAAARAGTMSPTDGILPTRRTQLVPMPNGSMFVLGPQTNMVWLHGINHDKRPEKTRSQAETAFGGERISLTFRHIGTFLDAKQELIWGQGAVGKTRADAGAVVSGEQARTSELVKAFGTENQSANFDWEGVYGAGSNVLNFSMKPKERPMIFYSASWPADLRVRIYLEEFKLAHETAGVTGAAAGGPYRPKICLRDNDERHTEVVGDIPILLYLERFHATYAAQEGYAPAVAATAMRLMFELGTNMPTMDQARALEMFEKQLGEAEFLAGPSVSVADCVFWPTIDHMIDEKGEEWERERWARTTEYHGRMQRRAAVERAVWSDAEEETG